MALSQRMHRRQACDVAATHARLHLARHGEVEAEWRTRIYGDLDVPLSRLGQAQSAELARRLEARPLARVVSSGLARAEYAAALIRAGRGLPRLDEPDLRELGRGRWAGFGREQVEAEDPGGWQRFWSQGGTVQTPGGESLACLEGRVLAALDAQAAQAAGAEIAVVAHKWVLRAATAAALGLPIEHSSCLHTPHALVATIDWPCGPARLSGARPRLRALGWQRAGASPSEA